MTSDSQFSEVEDAQLDRNDTFKDDRSKNLVYVRSIINYQVLETAQSLFPPRSKKSEAIK